MKGILLKIGNGIGSVVMKLSNKTRTVIMYACLTTIMLSCYVYQIDDYTLKFIYPAMLNAAIGTVAFIALIVIGIDRLYTEADFEKRWILVLFVFVSGTMVVLSGLLHYIGYSYIAMGLAMMFLLPAYCLVWGDKEHLTRLFKGIAQIIVVLYVIFFVVHVFVTPRSVDAFYLYGRYMGMGGNPNGTAKTATTAYLAALYLLGISKSKKKYALSVVMGMGLAMLLLTQSRANILALGLFTFFYLWMQVKNRWGDKESLKKFFASAAIVAVVVAAIVPISQKCLEWQSKQMLKELSDEFVYTEQGTGTDVLDRIGQGKNEDGTTNVDSMSSGRISIWTGVIKNAKLMGNDMKDYAYDGGNGIVVDHAHNTIMELLNRSGWIAAISFFLVELGSAIWILITAFNKKSVEEYQMFAVMGITAFGVASLFDIVVLPFAKMTVFVFYLCFAAMCVKRKSTIS